MEDNQSQEVLTRAEKRARKKEAKAAQRQKDKNSALAQIVGVILLVAAVVIGWQAFNKGESNNNIVTPGPGQISEHEQYKGNPNASVVITEYSDFQCPACAGYYPILKQLADEYGDRIAFAYRHFPLYSIHPNAEEAAWAAEAAGLQGKFWEMHDLLFDRQSQWSNERGIDDVFKGYAELLELDVAQWEADYDSDFVRDQVTADVVSANKERINATPTFYLNGSRMTQARSLEEFRTIIETELSIAGQNESEGNIINAEDIGIEIDGGDASGIQVEAVPVNENGQ